MAWDFEESALRYSPDIIIAHSYRHPHTLKALKIKEKLTKNGKICKVFLVTHAPFARGDSRSFIQNLIVWFYDLLIGKRTIRNFDRVIAISKWELPYLKKLGLKEEKIVYIPNGIPEEFFNLKKQEKEQNKILFLGRISPIKDLEVVIKSLSLLEDKSLTFEIVGPAEEEYKNKLIILIKRLNLEKRVIFSPAVYNIKEKIKKLDSCKIFVLPSKSEGMPQSLIEAMARGKICIASDIASIKDIIQDNKNGFLFKQGDEYQLSNTFKKVLKMNNFIIKDIMKNTVQMSRRFKWSILIKDLRKAYGLR
jgi:glycosyltransferase involved in cell wall biosynthesis